MASKGTLCSSKTQNKNKERNASESLLSTKHSHSPAHTVVSSESLYVSSWDGESKGNLLSVTTAQWTLTA